MKSESLPQRKATRLAGYNYSYPGAYFITICTHNRVHRFGQIANGTMDLNEPRLAFVQMWYELPQRFPHIRVDETVLMPNHLHGVLWVEGNQLDPELPSISNVVGAFKSLSTNLYIRGVNANGWPRFDGHLWQRSFYDHIVRTEAALELIRRYIQENPKRWHLDKYNPDAGEFDLLAREIQAMLKQQDSSNP